MITPATRRRPVGVKPPAHMPTLSQGDRGQTLEDPPALAGAQHLPLDLVGVVALELPGARGAVDRTMADSNSHFPIWPSQAAAENHLFIASEALAPHDLQQ